MGVCGGFKQWLRGVLVIQDLSGDGVLQDPTGHKTFDQHCYNVSHQCWITVQI